MLQEKITYVDFNGNEQTETCLFNLTRTELAEINLGFDGGLEDYLRVISENNSGAKILDLFKLFVSKAYGVVSEDGKRFIKKPELTEEFEQSAAYDELLFGLISDEAKAAAFVQGIIPQNLPSAPVPGKSPKK